MGQFQRAWALINLKKDLPILPFLTLPLIKLAQNILLTEVDLLFLVCFSD